jgi:hypothetical protein
MSPATESISANSRTTAVATIQPNGRTAAPGPQDTWRRTGTKIAAFMTRH